MPEALRRHMHTVISILDNGTTHALETALAEYVSYYNQTAKPINWPYTVEKREQQLEKRV